MFVVFAASPPSEERKRIDPPRSRYAFSAVKSDAEKRDFGAPNITRDASDSFEKVMSSLKLGEG